MYNKFYEQQADAMIKYVNEKISSGKEDSQLYNDMLHGYYSFKLETVPGQGHNLPLLLDRIYVYDKEHSETNQKDLMEKALHSNMNILGSLDDIYDSINIVFTQLQNEKNGTASFKIDGTGLLNYFKDAILAKEKFKGDPKRDEFLDHISNYAEEQYGIHM